MNVLPGTTHATGTTMSRRVHPATAAALLALCFVTQAQAQAPAQAQLRAQRHQASPLLLAAGKRQQLDGQAHVAQVDLPVQDALLGTTRDH